MTVRNGSIAAAVLAANLLWPPHATCQEEPGYFMWFAGARSSIHYSPPPWTSTFLVRFEAIPLAPLVEITTLPGNRHLLVHEGPSTYYVYERDTGAYLALPPLPLIPPRNWDYFRSNVVDQEGELVVLPAGGSGNPDGIYRLGRDRQWSRIAALPGLSPRWFDRVLVDLETGDYVVSLNGLFRVRPWGATTTISGATLQVTAQDPETGGFLFWDQNYNPNYGYALNRITGTGTITTTGITWPPNVGYLPSLTVVDDRPTAWGEYVAVGVTTGTGAGSAIGRVSRWGGVVNVMARPGDICTSLILDRTRNLSTANDGARNRWRLFVDFPYDAGYPYACLVGASGIRPGIRLADGRNLRLNVDPLTLQGLAGTLPGFSGLMGRLDSTGAATGRIDLSSAGPAARGIPFWVVGLVLDPGPPLSIRRVSPPIVVQMR